jgi:LysM repeat protein
METKPFQATLSRIAPIDEVEPSPTRWLWIVPGVMAVFALLIGGNYWVSESGRAFVAPQIARPISTPAKPSAVIEPPPLDRSAAQLSVGLRPQISPPAPEEATAPIAAQAPVSAPSQREPRYITIAEGQSLLRIARASHLSARAIAAANHLEPPYRLKAGSRLLVPDPDPPSDQGTQTSNGATRFTPSAAP